MNLVHAAGFLAADPEVRFTSSGLKVTNIRLAAKVRRGGNDKTIWWRVTCWGDQFDKIISYLKKGSAIMVIGEMMEPETYTDKNGKVQVSMSMTAVSLMFSPFGRTDKPQQETTVVAEKVENKDEAYAGFAVGEQAVKEEIGDDEIPF